MRIFKTKWFARFARKERIEEAKLCEAIERAERGSVDADLGGNLIKQRVARVGQGRSGGYRTLIAFQTQTRSVFLFGFAKNEKSDLDVQELHDLKTLTHRFLTLTDEELDRAVLAGELMEVSYGNENKE